MRSVTKFYIDNKLGDNDIRKIRNKQILKAYKEGYSQHMIAKVLDISQPAIYGVIKRNKQCVIVIT